MPPGSLIPRDIRKKLGMFEKFFPQEVIDQLKILTDAERSFVIPVRLQIQDKEKYLIIAGMLLSEKVPVKVSYDEVDLGLIEYALNKAKSALIQTQGKEELTEKEESDENK